MTRCRGGSGFSLVETIVAVGLMTAGLVTLAELLAIATAHNSISRSASHTAILAQQKIEQLRAESALTASPDDALRYNRAGWVEFLDGDGRIIAGGSTPPPGTGFIRRWSVRPLPATSTAAFALHVFVTPYLARVDGEGSSRAPGESQISTATTRALP